MVNLPLFFLLYWQNRFVRTLGALRKLGGIPPVLAETDEIDEVATPL
jgi:hypothetical protein